MRKPRSGAAVTLPQAAEILTRVERRPITPSMIRTIAVLGPDARAMQPLPQGTARQFTREDLAMVRAVLRLRDEGVSPVVSRVIAAHWRDELVKAWRKGLPMALAVVGMRGLLLWRGRRPADAIAWVDLPPIWEGLSPVMRAAPARRFVEGDASRSLRSGAVR